MRRIVLLAVPAVLSAILLYDAPSKFRYATAGDGQPAPKEYRDRVIDLIQKLGDKQFTVRDAASKELDAIGEPALAALRKTAAGDPDLEVRRRADLLVQSIAGRLNAAAAKKALASWQGDWIADGDQRLSIKGDQWISGIPNNPLYHGTLKNIEVRAAMTHVDVALDEGPTAGQTCRIIFRLDGDTLHYCGTYDLVRPTEFKTAGNSVYSAFKRSKAGPLLPAAVRLDSAALTTALTLPEIKDGIHRIHLNGRLMDGGTIVLSLDPSAPKFDPFGFPVPDGEKKPLVNWDCSLKLIKKETGRKLFEVHSPKLASRLTLAVYQDTLPWGDARLMVLAKDGTIRAAISLNRPPQEKPQNFPPCHPGCFPAGTLVRVPEGTKSIERIRKGDAVTAIDADGKVLAAKVTGVFTTKNRLIEVQTDDGTLLTTETQPVVLKTGGFRPAGELKAGDHIWRWVDGRRRAVAVKSIAPTGRVTDVFNLILGEPTCFIAGDFLVRSKPPGVGEEEIRIEPQRHREDRS